MHYASIIKNDVVNGYDVCVSFWSQGCPNGCPGCHNPETWDFDGGFEKDEDLLIEEIVNAITKNGIKRNLSLLGGEPLCEENIQFTNKLLGIVKHKFPTIKTFVWTGYNIENIKSDTLNMIDVLIDGRYEQDKRDINLPFRGSSNQRIIDVQKSLQTGEIVLWQT